MHKFLLITASCFFATLALAHASTPAFAQAANEREIHVEEVGFDQTLTLLVLTADATELNMELRDADGYLVYSTSRNITNQDVVEIDLSEVEAGTYELTLALGDHSQVQTLIMP